MDIYWILSSKPHNPHYLNRYITFVLRCQQKNVGYYGYVEKHHICPKAKDMFPEYESFSVHEWNKAELTPRQHFISHMLLWKAYPNILSVVYAAYSMRNYQDRRIHSKLYENLKTEFVQSQTYKSHEWHSKMSTEEKYILRRKISNSCKNLVQSKMKNESVTKRITKDDFDKNQNYVGHTKGMTTVKDSNGKFYFVSVTDDRIKSGELVGVNKGNKLTKEVREKISKSGKGRKLSEETKIKMRTPKGPQRKLVCPHCNKEGGSSNIKRYHFENCSSLTIPI